jgi:putative membrane protein
MEKKSGGATDHLANERTFLAWIRTSIAIMAFGFVVVKFSLFIKQIAMIMENKDLELLPHSGYSAILGVVLVGIGVVMAVMAFYRYKRIERDLLANAFHPTSKITAWFTYAIIVVGLLLILYLFPSIKST